jgi:hypothetical protein
MRTASFHIFACACTLAMPATPAVAQAAPGPDTAAVEAAQRAFDWELGRWKTRLRRLANPLSGAEARWLEYTGTTVVSPVLGGRANLAELRVAGPAGRIEGASLRLYSPGTQQWSLNYASVRAGVVSQPVRGGFKNDRGEFFGLEELDGRTVLVRFIVKRCGPDSAYFEQAYSADGGTTWEINWVATDTRVTRSPRPR